MLLQSNENGDLILLPALPEEWPDGEINGLKAPGNLTVNMAWKEMKVTDYRIKAVNPGYVNVYINGILKRIFCELTFADVSYDTNETFYIA